MWKHIFVLGLFLSLSGPTVAQQSAEHVYTPVPIPGKCQDRWGPAAKDDGTIGADFTQEGGNSGALYVLDVAVDGPAAKAGIRPGDTLMGREDKQKLRAVAIPLDACDLRRAIQAHLGKTLLLWVIPRPGATASIAKPVAVQVERFADVYPDRASGHESLISQQAGTVGASVDAELLGIPGKTLWLRLGIVNSQENALLKLDEEKIFILDKNGHQVQLVPFAQIKYDDEKLIAEMQSLLSSTSYASPPAIPPVSPPPPTRYRVSGTSDGTYTVTPMGTDSAIVSGTSEGSYTVEPEYSTGEQITFGVESILDSINRIKAARETARYNQLIEQQNQQLLSMIRDVRGNLAQWETEHFDTTRLIAPGETRSGTIVFKPSETDDLSSVKAIICLTDASTGKEEFVTFDFEF